MLQGKMAGKALWKICWRRLLRISREEQGLDVEYTGSISLPKEVYFETADFYACTALIPKGSGSVKPGVGVSP